MRVIDVQSLESLNGSRPGDTISVYVWYNGQLAHDEALDISQWQFSWDTTRQVQTFECSVVDSSGALVPRLFEDTLGVGGSELQVTYRVGGAGVVNMGWYRITNPKPEERWRTYVINKLGQVNTGSPIPPGKKLAFVSGGAVIHITAEDRAGNIGRDTFEAPESPKGSSPTILSEISRLLEDICPVAVLPGVVDRSVNKSLIYKDDRLDAVQDLCKRISCDYRMNGDGQFEVYPIGAGGPVWTLRGGPEGVLVDVNWEQNIDGMFNVFIADGTGTKNGKQYPIRGRAEISNGPLAAGPPFGRVKKFYSSTMLTTQKQCDDYAKVMRDTFISSLTVLLNVTCAPNPALQQGETVVVASPVVGDRTLLLTGTVRAMTLKSNGSTVDAMTLVVEVPYALAAAAFASSNEDAAAILHYLFPSSGTWPATITTPGVSI